MDIPTFLLSYFLPSYFLLSYLTAFSFPAFEGVVEEGFHAAGLGGWRVPENCSAESIASAMQRVPIPKDAVA